MKNKNISENFEFRATTLEERKEFYKKEFSVEKIKNWFKKNKMPLPQLCAIDAGSETGFLINKKYKNIMLYFEFTELKKKIEKYIPEDIYYDRNVYAEPKKVLENLNFKNYLKQELVFDVDSNNIKCNHQGLVCEKCLKKAYDFAIKMKKILEKQFKKVIIVYSGRGFHLHVLDEKAYCLDNAERKKLSKKLSDFPIDPWVSGGNISLIRMPFSLHGEVSRIVTPIENDSWNKSTIPNFLKIQRVK